MHLGLAHSDGIRSVAAEAKARFVERSPQIRHAAHVEAEVGKSDVAPDPVFEMNEPLRSIACTNSMYVRP